MRTRQTARRSILGVSLAAALLGLCMLVSAPVLSAAVPVRSFAVASESPGATKQAGRLLAEGGNAVDAAVLAALIAGLTHPSSSGIGGGGFALVWSAREERASVLDFREVAPLAVDAALLDKRPVPGAQRGQLVGVPGEVAGLYELHQRFGKMKWQDVVGRAARFADRGFATEPHTAQQLQAQQGALLAGFPAFRGVYLPNGVAPKLGQLLRAPRLANTLRRIASEGRRAFYEGPIAQDIVSTVKAAGGGLQLSDLAGYAPVAREPLRATWDGKEILTMPLPSAGGLLVLQTLALFSRAELSGLNDMPAKRIHLLAEAMRGSFADRSRYLGDPAFVQVDVSQLLSPSRLSRRKQRIAEDRTHTQPRFGLEEAGTHHLVSVDQEGNWVSLTTTINDSFGAKLITDRSGIILNNELADFSTSESVAAFGLSESPNRPRPGARPVSSMCPTLVLDHGRPVLALGGSGGLTIAPNVTQVLLSVLASGTEPRQAVEAPRFSVPAPRSGQTLWLESALAQLYADDLRGRGELLLSRDFATAVQLVARSGRTLQAAADPRKYGAAEVVNPAQ